MLLSEKQACEVLCVSRPTLAGLRKQGKIQYLQAGPGKKVQYTREALDEYLERITRPCRPAVTLVGGTYRKRRRA